MFDTVGIIAVIDNKRVLVVSQSALKEDDRKQTYVAHVSKRQQITRSMNLDLCITVFFTLITIATRTTNRFSSHMSAIKYTNIAHETSRQH